MTVLLIFAALLPLGCILCAISRSRYGHLRLSELPGFVWVMLAGPEYRRAAAEILARRGRQQAIATPAQPPPRPSLQSCACDMCGDRTRGRQRCVPCERRWIVRGLGEGCPSCAEGYAHALHPRERES